MKIAFIGTHGVGKTTLCYDLAACLKKRDVTVELVREVARECPLPINRDTTLTAQSWILHTQIAWELAAAAKSEVVVCDRAALDNFCYLKRAGGAGDREKVLEALVASWTPTYDVLVKVPICGKLRFDGVRDTDIRFQHDIDELIDATLEAWGVPHVTLDPENREGWIGAVLAQLLPVLKPQELLFPDSAPRDPI
jgi:thymidylate kinase